MNILKRLSLAVTVASDVEAPLSASIRPMTSNSGSVHGVGLDAEFKFYKSENLDIKTYLDGSGLFYTGGQGFGGALWGLDACEY